MGPDDARDSANVWSFSASIATPDDCVQQSYDRLEKLNYAQLTSKSCHILHACVVVSKSTDTETF